jgi:hypothetical protein
MVIFTKSTLRRTVELIMINHNHPELALLEF